MASTTRASSGVALALVLMASGCPDGPEPEDCPSVPTDDQYHEIPASASGTDLAFTAALEPVLPGGAEALVYRFQFDGNAFAIGTVDTETFPFSEAAEDSSTLSFVSEVGDDLEAMEITFDAGPKIVVVQGFDTMSDIALEERFRRGDASCTDGTSLQSLCSADGLEGDVAEGEEGAVSSRGQTWLVRPRYARAENTNDGFGLCFVKYFALFFAE